MRMLSIILCDDDRFLLDLEVERIQQEIKKNQLPAQVVCSTTDSRELFCFLENNEGSFLFFLDLDFGEGKLNGIDIAKKIKLRNVNSKVVFVTNHKEMALEVLNSGVEPFGYLEKTINMKNMSLAYRKYICMAVNVFSYIEDQDDENIELSLGYQEKVTIAKHSITYVEALKNISHGIAYHTMDGSCIVTRDSIEHVQEKLGVEFIKSHRSILVNRSYLVGFSEGTVRLSNGEKVPCSIRQRKEVKKWI